MLVFFNGVYWAERVVALDTATKPAISDSSDLSLQADPVKKADPVKNSGSAKKTILVLGDSISAAYGMDKSVGWVALLEQRLNEQCPNIQVHNASVSGETTAGGRQRLPALLRQHQPQLLILELGGNDGLRGLMPTKMADNLGSIIDQSEAVEAEVVMLGMLMPPNFGEAYVKLFAHSIARVAAEKQVVFLDFFLRGIAEDSSKMQEDGLHPTAASQPQLLENAWGVLEEPVNKMCVR